MAKDNENIHDNEQEPRKKKGIFKRLRSRLSKTKQGLVSRVKSAVRLRGKFDEELLEEMEGILIQADVGVETTLKIIDRLREEAGKKEMNDPDTIIDTFKGAIYDILEHRQGQLELEPDTKPYVMLVAGVNGVGKTTTIAKLARKYKDHGKSVMLVAGDTFRAAAIEQLDIWAQRTDSDIIKQSMGSDAASVCFDAVKAAQKRGTDIIIIDTAGRLHTRVNLMAELKKMVRVIKKILPEAPHETLLVLDATTGQNAIAQTKIFKDDINVSGVVITKLDGTAKGGIIVAVADLFDIPVKLIGVGEQAEDLRPFDANEFIDALFAENSEQE